MTPEPLRLHPDRFFSPDPAVRAVARDLYASVADLPARLPARPRAARRCWPTNAPFPEPTALFITPDHYIFRMLLSQGVRMEDLGIPTRDGTPVEADPRAVWQRFADHYHLFLGTPTRAWLDHVFAEVFGVERGADAELGRCEIYDHIAGRLGEPDVPAARPVRPVRHRGADDDRRRGRLAGAPPGASASRSWDGRVIPCFRPDAVFRIASPEWPAEVDRLARRRATRSGLRDVRPRAGGAPGVLPVDGRDVDRPRRRRAAHAPAVGRRGRRASSSARSRARPRPPTRPRSRPTC